MKNHERANKIIKKRSFTNDGFSHYTSMIALQMILKHKSKLEKDAFDKLFEHICLVIVQMIDNKEYEYGGVNDSEPCISSCVAIVGGEFTGNRRAVEWGIKNLKQMCALLERRGLVSEFVSQIYTPTQMLAMAEIVNFAKNEEAKRIALYLENRLAHSFFAFYHNGMGKVCGPYSRGSELESMGYAHMGDMLLYCIIGRKTISALDELFSKEKMSKLVHGSKWFQSMQYVWISQCRYHINDEIIQEAMERKFPYEVRGSCEFSSSRDDLEDGKNDVIYSASENEVSCYMTEEYAVGVNRVPFHNGVNSEILHIMCKKREIIEHSKDLQTVYLRYVVNNDVPEITNMFWDRGRKLGLVNKNMGFIGYKPTERIVGKNVRSLKLCIVIERVYEGDLEVEQNGNEIYIRIHNTYVMFYAMNNGGEVKIENANDNTLISLYNYFGEEKELTADYYFGMINGLVFHVTDSSECSFEEFKRYKRRISDRIFKTSHSRQSYMRNVFFECGEKSIELEYDTECNGVKYSLIDDKPADTIYYYDSVNGEYTPKKLRNKIRVDF
ncbi:MAG: hypothetical protein IJD30_07050 [Clostridia bacterium]|nr:hypothetical protein [Clostridia bacterium]